MVKEIKGHKLNCSCGVCKAKRGEIKGKNHPMFGIHPKKHFFNYQCAWCIGKRGEYKGKNHPNFRNSGYSEKHFCIEVCGNEISFPTWKKGKQRCASCAGKVNWRNKDYRERILKLQRMGSKLKPNKPEKLLNKLLNELFPNEYKINVKGNSIINGKVPDFINCNGQKKIIELFGDYWHSKEWVKKHGCFEDTEQGRIKCFKKLGYQTLIVWEHELKNLDKVVNKLIKFHGEK